VKSTCQFILSLLLLYVVTPFAMADTIVEVAEGTELKEPFGTGFDEDGNLWIIEMKSGNRLLRVDPSGEVTHVAGQAEAGYQGDGGDPLEARFNGPHNLAVRPNGAILISDTWNGVVREFDPKTSVLRTVPGWRAPEGKERSNGPYCIALAPDGKTLHIADLRQIIALDLSSGEAEVVAGNGKKGVPVDGTVATESPLVDPRAVAVDRHGNVYILERGGHALRVVDANGIIRTVVNRSGQKGHSGDGGPAIDATLNGPKHLCIDRDDSVIIADAENHVIRRYAPSTGKIEAVAGTGKKTPDGVGGDPHECGLARPHGVTVHPVTGELYITDSYNNRILKILRK
jgi:DNA-binding beta-propeller fold protein YncE